MRETNSPIESIRMKKRRIVLAVAAIVAAGLFAAATAGGDDKIPPVERVDLPRFMGDWYVIAHIPTFIEKDAYDALESYAIREDGKIQTVYTQRKGGFDAELKTMRPVGTVREGTGNAVWGMQFVWPIKAEYVIVHLDEGYTQTIIGRSKRDYVWVMARTPSVPDEEYAALVERVRALGYDVDKLRKVPQRPLEQRNDARDRSDPR